MHVSSLDLMHVTVYYSNSYVLLLDGEFTTFAKIEFVPSKLYLNTVHTYIRTCTGKRT